LLTTSPGPTGLKSATTYIPGPIGAGRTSSYRLSWDPAKDNKTPANQSRYDLYQATTTGDDFSTSTYVTTRGATTFDTPLLTSDHTYYSVVRARDHIGNEDANLVERAGVNLCL